MQFQSLRDVLTHEIQDLYSAEQQVKQAMPKLMKAFNSKKLKDSFVKHQEQTEEQIKRLKEAAQLLDIEMNGEPCKGMAGLLEETDTLLKVNPSIALDAALISSAQRIEHYEIAAYGTAATLAETLGEDKVAKLLKASLSEEEKTDQILTQVAESEINNQAAKM